MIEQLQNWATLFATLMGVYVAFGGLRAWRRETTGKRDIELCQTVIEKFYEAEHKISLLRSPMSYDYEGEARKTDEAESEDEKRRRNLLFVPLARFNSQWDFWSEFLSYKFRMRALFGEDAASSFEEIEQVLRSFRASAQTRYQALYSNPDGLSLTSRNRFEEAIWEGLAEDDRLKTSVKTAIVKMENICIPIVRTNANGLIRRIWKDGLASI